MKRLVPLLFLCVSCSKPATSEKSAQRRDDAAVPQADAQVELARLPLGMPDVAAYAYRSRAGHAAFRLARESEAAGDWATVATRCREALAADPQHLDAAYLLAVALAKTNAGPEQIVLPLAIAVAGDFAKWGAASLEQPALQPFLATAVGQAWRRQVEADRDAFIAALGRSLLVTAQADLYAHDPHGKRWYRLTRTAGAVVAALHVRSRHQVAYVTRERVIEHGKQRTRVGIGVVDLGSGRVWRPIEAPPTTTLRIGFSDKKQAGFIVRAGKRAWRLVGNGKLKLAALPARARPDAPAYLADMMRMDVTGRSARIDRTAVANVSADWDDSSLASAVKIGRSKRVVTVPSPGLIDGDTATWSSDGTQLAFIAQLTDECPPDTATTAAYVADGATGSVSELERAVSGIAIDWVADRKLAVAGDRGVSIIDLVSGERVALVGADGLTTPRRSPECAPDVRVEDVIAADDAEPALTSEQNVPNDAGVDAK